MIFDADTQKFLNTLFDEGEFSCFTESAHGYRVSSGPRKEDLFFCINPLHPTQDFNPTKDWHSTNLPRRADHNVTAYRNLLIELDNVPLDQQIDYVRDKVPVSTIVYSGGKSYHFIVSLVEPLADIKTYKQTWNRIHQLLPEIDRSCKNPSRLSRLPNRVRPETNKEQKLMYVGERISWSQLGPLLPPVQERFSTYTPTKGFVPVAVLAACCEPDKIMIERGISGRNAFFFYLGCRLAEAELTPAQKYEHVKLAYDNLLDRRDFSLDEALLAARVEQ